MAVDVVGSGSTFKAGTVHALFKANPGIHESRGAQPTDQVIDIPYDVTSDGQRFVFTERIATGSEPIPNSVVLNWTTDLEK